MSRRTVKKTMVVVFSGIGALLIIAFAALLAISGIFEQPKYLEPWQKDYSRKFDDPRIRLAAHGLLASNGHNMQPWKIHLDGEDPAVFYLYADSGRLTNEVDPFARQMMITQGTFLEYVGIAGNKSGYRAGVELFPEGGYNERELSESMKVKPVAKIKLAKGEPQNAPLYDSIFLPNTNRAEYQPAKPTAEQVNRLEAVGSDAGMTVRIFQDKENVDKLTQYVIEGAVIEAGVNRVMEESGIIFRANEYQKNKYRYGFSVEGQGTSGIMQHLMQGLVTLFPSMNSGKAASDLFIQSARRAAENTPAYAIIVTADNSRPNQVSSGMVYSKLVLTAQSLGLVMQPLSQVLEEYPEMKELYDGIHRDYAPEGGTIQMLVRLGRPAKDVPQSMRRDVMDLLQEDSPAA